MAITFRSNYYENTHGQKPRGRYGYWGLIILPANSTEVPKGDLDIFWFTGTLAQAKAACRDELRNRSIKNRVIQVAP